MNKTEIKEKLDKYGQSHLLKYENELSEEEKEKLWKQLENLDFSILNHKSAMEERGTFSPIDAVETNEIKENESYYRKVGIAAIQEGRVGAVLLAGGQGSRLGFNKPKGMFNMGIKKTLYIFECLINNILEVVREAGAWIPLFIMTSKQNDADTKAFFKEHGYFGYSRDNIEFFVQDQLPTIDTNGKFMLSSKGEISTAPNGNGGWYSSMVKAGTLSFLDNLKIEWLNVFAVDNVLQKIADPCFIGAVITSGKKSGAKVVSKSNPDERVGVMCLEDGKPSIVEYYEMTPEMREQKREDGGLAYKYGVILNYIFKIDSLNDGLRYEMPLHKAFKKIPYINENGEKISPEEPNAYKYETLVLDMVKNQDSCLVYEVERNKEFAPVKNKTGVDSVDTARELLLENGIEL